jgi:hypothetical protein
LLPVLASLACVENRSAPASTLAVRRPVESPLKLNPGQEGLIVVQAMNEDKHAVDDVQVSFLALDNARFEFIDAQGSAPLVRTTAFDEETGLRGAARIKFRVKPDAAYGTSRISASLTQSEPLADAGVAPVPGMTEVTVEVVPDLSKVKLTPLPSTPIELRSGGTESALLFVQATDDLGQPVNGVELYAEVFGGADAPVTLVEGEASQPRSIEATARNTVNGLAVVGVAQWEVRLKAAVSQPTSAQVRFGLARSSGSSTVSQLGKFDLNLLPAEEPAP